MVPDRQLYVSHYALYSLLHFNFFAAARRWCSIDGWLRWICQEVHALGGRPDYWWGAQVQERSASTVSVAELVHNNSRNIFGKYETVHLKELYAWNKGNCIQ